MNDARTLAAPATQTSTQTSTDRARCTPTTPATRRLPFTAPLARGKPWRLAPTPAYLRALREADLAVRQAVQRQLVLGHTARLHANP